MRHWDEEFGPDTPENQLLDRAADGDLEEVPMSCAPDKRTTLILRLGQMQALLQAGVSPDCFDRERLTPLMKASLMVDSHMFALLVVARSAPSLFQHHRTPQGDEEAVCMLIEAGADLDAVDDTGWTALHHAAGAGRPLIVEVRSVADSDTTAAPGPAAWRHAADCSARLLPRPPV